MNIDWDQELKECFTPNYTLQAKKISTGRYQLTFLEGNVANIECSVEGYLCSCHQKTYETPEGLLRQHSPQYVSAFNEELFKKLEMLADHNDPDDKKQ